MPLVKVHCAISRQRTGKTYYKLHKWLDSGKGVNHRKENHFCTIALKNHVFKEYGGHEAVSEWLFHIALDNLSTHHKHCRNHLSKPTNSHKFDFSESDYVEYKPD